MTDNLKKKYTKLHQDFQKRIETGKLGKLSLYDFYEVGNLAKELIKNHKAKTFNKNVADYFSSFGFLVTMDSANINYVITEP